MSALRYARPANLLGRSVLDHINREAGELVPFGEAAGSLINSEWWRTVPEYSQPEPVSGEIER